MGQYKLIATISMGFPAEFAEGQRQEGTSKTSSPGTSSAIRRDHNGPRKPQRITTTSLRAWRRSKAIEEDAGLALKALFYFRDVRGGQGERKVFRVLAKALAEQMPYYITKNMKYVPEFGRWDDLFALVGTRVEPLAFAYMKDQLVKDVDAFFAKQTGISLLAKWLPSENTSSKKTRSLATRFRIYLGWTPRNIGQLWPISVATSSWSSVKCPQDTGLPSTTKRFLLVRP